MLARIGAPGDSEVFGRETRYRRKVHGHITKEGVTRSQCRRIGQADHVSRPRIVQRRALLAEYRLGVLGDERLSGRRMGEDITTLESAGAHPCVSDAIAVGGVHAGLHLEDERTEGRLDWSQIPVDIQLSTGRGREAHQGVQELVHAEVQCRRGEQDRRCHAVQECFLVVVTAVGSKQLALFDRVVPVDAGSVACARGRDVFLGCRGSAAGGAGEPDEVAGTAVQHALEVSGDADRPCQWCGFEADALVDLVEQFQCVPARTVPLVDHGDDRDASMATHLEQFESLRLKAFRRIDQHDRAIDRAEHAVGVFGEVRVPRGVEQIDDAVLPVGRDIGELQGGGCDRDAPGLFHLHPVRHRGAASGLAVDGAGLVDDPGVQDECLGECRLSCVGMADDGEGSAAKCFSRQTFGGAPTRGRADVHVVIGHCGIDGICRGPEPSNRQVPGPLLCTDHIVWIKHGHRGLQPHQNTDQSGRGDQADICRHR